ncbi:transposase [Paraburkholderia youngii]
MGAAQESRPAECGTACRFDALVANVTTKRTARAWLYREQLREILDRKQINVVSEMLEQWCTNVMRSAVEAMKEVARMIRKYFDGIVAWPQARQTNGFLEALNGLFQTAKRRARGYANLETMPKASSSSCRGEERFRAVAPTLGC